MDEYEFAAAKADVERFFWTDLCDNYIELAKSRLYGDAATGANGTTAGAAGQTNGSAAGSGTTDRNGALSAGTGAGSPTQSTAGAGSREGAQYALYQALLGVLKLLAPFLPHITEEIYLGGFAGTDRAKSIHLSRWPEAEPDWSAEGAGRAGEAILEVADTVRRWKAERQLSVGAALAALRIACPADVLPDLQGAVRDLQSVTRAATVEIVPGSNGTLEVTVEREEAPATT
jgi:valyl-tRNA synthetase